MSSADDLRITTSTRDGVCVVGLAGELDVASTPQLHGHLAAVLGGDLKRLIVDLSQTTYLDSSGVAELALTGKRFTARGGSFGLVLGESRVRTILDVAGLTHLYVSER